MLTSKLSDLTIYIKSNILTPSIMEKYAENYFWSLTVVLLKIIHEGCISLQFFRILYFLVLHIAILGR